MVVSNPEKVLAAKKTHDFAYHNFDEAEKIHIRQELLNWYDENKRDLPWRKPHGHPRKVSIRQSSGNYPADAQRAYEVWISEIMLQQTQVKTVLAYYTTWMQKWPTIFDLASTSLSDVNETWAGLGYYSRAKRIHEASRKMVDENGGILPRTAATLATDVPGVGRYTAGAIASIAYGERAELVDGNVVRVLSRLRSIGVDPKSKAAVTLHWELAKDLLDPDRSGDFNQALMEHGATVCTPQNPQCTTCPIQISCKAFAEQTAAAVTSSAKHKSTTKEKVKKAIPDIEDHGTSCAICGELPDSLADYAITRYPRKAIKKPSRKQDSAVCILERVDAAQSATSEYLLVQRPASGLLGGLWEFPSVILSAIVSEEVETDTSYAARILVSQRYIESVLGHSLDANIISRRDLGSVKHLFSHIEQTYWAEHLVIKYDPHGSTPSATRKVSATKTTPSTIPSKKKTKKSSTITKSTTVYTPPLFKWVHASTLSTEAIPTGLKKVFELKGKNPVNASSLKRSASGKGSGTTTRASKVRKM